MTAGRYLLIVFFTMLWFPNYAQSQTFVVGADFDCPPFSYFDESANAGLLGVPKNGSIALQEEGRPAKINSKSEAYERTDYQYKRVVKFVLIALSIGVLLLLLTFIWVGLLRKQIKKKTKRIILKNKALREREERLQLIINLSDEGVIILQNFKFVLVNPKVLEISGREEDELKKMLFLDLIHPEDREFTKNNWEKRLKGETLEAKYEIRVLRSNDTIRWVEIHGIKIDWKGEPATLNFIKDVTEAKAISRSLSESEAKYRNMAENSSDII